MLAELGVIVLSMSALLKLVPNVHITGIGKGITYIFRGTSGYRSSPADPTKLTMTEYGVPAHKDKTFWVNDHKVYMTSDYGLTQADVAALLSKDENRRRLRLQDAHAIQAMPERLESSNNRVSIPKQVRMFVWQRDRAQCVDCNSNHNLEFDHIIPLSKGGSNTERNLQLLCALCNRRKGATLG